MLFSRMSIWCFFAPTFLYFAGESQMRLAKRAISSVDMETEGLLYGMISDRRTVLSVTASERRVV